MSEYVGYRDAHHCQTVRCALGYAPVLGIGMAITKAVQDQVDDTFRFYDYSMRVLLEEHTVRRKWSHIWEW